jgi:hypothetical protein
MKKELEEKLFQKYPKIFAQKDLSMSQTCMCWGIDTGDGWYNLLDVLCNNIQSHLDNIERANEYKKEKGQETTPIEQIEAVQVKEKFGGLRFYVNYQDQYIEGLIDMAESMSYKICETCGNTGSPNKEGWIITLCEHCREKRK